MLEKQKLRVTSYCVYNGHGTKLFFHRGLNQAKEILALSFCLPCLEQFLTFGHILHTNDLDLITRKFGCEYLNFFFKPYSNYYYYYAFLFLWFFFSVYFFCFFFCCFQMKQKHDKTIAIFDP